MVSEADLHAFHLSRIAPPPQPSLKPQISPPPTEPLSPLIDSATSHTNNANQLKTSGLHIITEADVHAFHLSRICDTQPHMHKPNSRPPKRARISLRKPKNSESLIPALPRIGPSNLRLSLSTNTYDTSYPIFMSFSPDISYNRGSGDLPPSSPSPPCTPIIPRLEVEEGEDEGGEDDDEGYDQLRSSSVVHSQRSDRTIRAVKAVRGDEGIIMEEQEEEADGKGPPSSPLAEKGGGGSMNGHGMAGRGSRKSKAGGRASELRQAAEGVERTKGPSWATRTPGGA